MTTLSNALGRSFSLPADSAVNANDLVQITPRMTVKPVKYSDFAVVAAERTVSAVTSLTTSYIMPGAGTNEANDTSPLVLGADGYFYALNSYSAGNTGLVLQKLNSAFAVVASVAIDTTNNIYQPKIVQLVGSNFAVTYNNGSNQFIAVVSAALAVVLASTSIDTQTATIRVKTSIIALAAGGFAVSYNNTGATEMVMRLAAYSNVGAQIFAPVAVMTNPNASGNYAQSFLGQLSNGNVLVGFSINGPGCTGMHGIYSSTTGAAVLATVQLPGTPDWTAYFYANILPTGYYAFVYQNTGVDGVAVFNNAGVQQGTSYALPTGVYGQPSYNVGANLMNDGTNFICLYSVTAAAVFAIATIPITGGAGGATIRSSVNVTPFISTATYYGGHYTYRNGTTGQLSIVGTSNLGTTALSIAIIDGSANTILAPVVLTGTAGFCSLDIMLPGDSTLLFVGETGTLSILTFKYENTAILGVAQNAAVAGSPVSVLPSSVANSTLYKTINAILGTSGTTFDHTAATIPANKGILYTSAVNLKGF